VEPESGRRREPAAFYKKSQALRAQLGETPSGVFVMLAIGSDGSAISWIGILVTLGLVAAFGTHWCWFIGRCWSRKLDLLSFGVGVLGLFVPLVRTLHGFCIWIGARMSAEAEARPHYQRRRRKPLGGLGSGDDPVGAIPRRRKLANQ
jgi:hypothetical protein